MCKDTRYKEQIKLDEELAKYKVKCKCGHKMVLIHADKVICSWCGYYVYKDKKTEFKEMIKKCMKKNQNQDTYHTNNMII